MDSEEAFTKEASKTDSADEWPEFDDSSLSETESIKLATRKLDADLVAAGLMEPYRPGEEEDEDEESEEDAWEFESLYEDALEGMGDSVAVDSCEQSMRPAYEEYRC